MSEQDKPKQDETASKRPAIDWERIEVEFRAGILSLREIAALHPGVSHVSISKRAKRDGWERDLSKMIAAKADALVNKEVVNSQVNSGKSVSERQIIDANAARIAEVRGEHRKDISRSRTLVMTLLGELEAETSHVLDLEELGDLMRCPNENGIDKLNDLYRKIISLPGRVDSGKKLTEALKNLIGLEREAYGLSVEKEGESQPGGKFYRSSQVLTDAERAVRLHALLNKQPGADAK